MSGKRTRDGGTDGETVPFGTENVFSVDPVEEAHEADNEYCAHGHNAREYDASGHGASGHNDPQNSHSLLHSPTVKRTVSGEQFSLLLGTTFQSPITRDTELAILAGGTARRTDPGSHDKPYYDDRYNDAVFDPVLALDHLPKMLTSIGGMLLTGLLFDRIIAWDVFQQVPELFILIPVLLSLRGILEQSLATRLATAARIGIMESDTGRRKIWQGNLHLLMFQSIAAGVIAGLMCSLFAFMSHDTRLSLWRVVLMVLVAAASSASVSLLSGVFVYGVLWGCQWLRVSPENIVGPLTTSFGGFMALVVLACHASFFHLWMRHWVGTVVACGGLAAAGLVCYAQARRSVAVSQLAAEGWPSLLFSLVVTSMSGLLLQRFISEYQHLFVLYLPVFNGVTGNVAGIYCSEVMAHLHLFQLNPLLPRKTALTLLLLSNPIQIALVLLISCVNSGTIAVSPVFLVVYMLFGNAQVLLLMALADGLIKLFWRWRMKPETHTAALMSTLGDLAGMMALVSAFWILKSLNSLPVAEGGAILRDAFDSTASFQSAAIRPSGHEQI